MKKAHLITALCCVALHTMTTLPNAEAFLFGLGTPGIFGGGNVFGNINPTQAAGLLGGAALATGLGVGLGSLLSQRGGLFGGGRRGFQGRGFRRRFGKREVVHSEAEQLSELEMQIVRTEEKMTQVMAETDPSDCYRRMICTMATGAYGSGKHPITHLLSNETDAFTTKKVKNFKYHLRIAAKIGKLAKNADACEGIFQCEVPKKTLDNTFSKAFDHSQ